MTRPVLVWFGRDLRLDDHPALACLEGRPALFVYALDDEGRTLGGAARWWLSHSLARLGADIAARGGRLDILRGSSERWIPEVARAAGAAEVLWGRRYGGADVARLTRIKAALKKQAIAARSFNLSLLREPWEVASDEGRPYRVFTPFWRRHRTLGAFPAPVAPPERLVAAPWPADAPGRVDLDALRLRPQQPEQQADGRGLARAVRTQKAVDHALRHGQIEVADGAMGAETVGQTAGFNGRSGGGLGHDIDFRLIQS